MNQSFGALKRVFDLINKTGDRCIVVLPSDSDQAYAVMSLAAYERLVLGKSEITSLTENELLDKINRDIAIWKSQQEEDKTDMEVWAEKARERSAERGWEKEWEDRLADEDEDWDEDENYEEDPYYFEKV